jgi:APA family basic amino acid/polyamine antiporter
MTEEKLVRGISRWDLTAIAINTIIGAGIFGLPAKVTALIGSWSLLAFVVCALIIGLVVICFAEVSSRFQSTGGMYLYAKEGFGSIVGFEVGWLYWIVRVTTFAANCNLLTTYLSFFYPGAKEGATRVVLITLVVVFLTLINLIGVKQSTIFTNIFTVGKIVPLVIFALLGLFFIQPANLNFSVTPGYTAFSSATLLLIYAFVGFEATVIPAGESKNPQKDMPFALLVALGVVAVLFILIQFVAVGTLPELAKSEKPLADAATVFMGAFGAAFITIGAVISILGNLNGGFLATTRIPFAMSEQKELPEFIGKTHKKFKTPYISILITAIVILIWTIQSTFFSAVAIATITRLMVYAATCASLPVFRNRSDVSRAEFTAPFGVGVAILSLILIAWLLIQVDYLKEGLPILIAAGVGLILYFINSLFRKDPENERSQD